MIPQYFNYFKQSTFNFYEPQLERRMKLKIINPNTTASITCKIEKDAKKGAEVY